MRDLSWNIEQEGFDAAREHGIESIFTVGNGYLGVRGALDTPLPGSQGDLFIAGVYDRKSPDRPYSELELIGDDREDFAHTELISAPFPFRVQLLVDGAALDPSSPTCRAHRRTLDLRCGMLHGEADYDTAIDRRVTVRTRRCASRADLHLLLQEITVTPVNHSAALVLDASLSDPELARNHPHLTQLEAPRTGAGDPGLQLQRFRTQASNVEIGIAARMLPQGDDRAALRFELSAEIGRTLTFRRFVAVYTSMDVAAPAEAAAQHIAALRFEDFEPALGEHVAQWDAVWKRADVRIPGSTATEQALRFNAYHLISAADRDPRVSVGARALSGRAYEGHVFWDVEMFKLPFYLHTVPEVARTLLGYRHHTLDGARRRARTLGYRGACYAWESTVTGDDVTPRSIRLKTTGKEIPIFTGTQQLHVTAAVAHAIGRYWRATQDATFMRDAGVEMLAETARFWSSRCTRGSRHLHLRGVVGPDEYHHSVDDNAYTNWMARENLQSAVDAVRWLQRTDPHAAGVLCERLALHADEASEWEQVARELFCPVPNAHGVIEQFEGFFDLEDHVLPPGERFKAPIHRLFDWDLINRRKLIKQADVLMLLHVFPDAFGKDVLAANYRYYEPLTDHASSLSPGIHAAIAARIGLREDAERYFRESLWLDLSDRMDNSALGVHPACMGATWQALAFGFLGVSFTEQGPTIDPAARARLPDKWCGAALTLSWRGQARELECLAQRST